MEDAQINKLIDDKIAKAMAFATKKYGDTPTDALQLTPKKYVSSVVAAATTPPGGSDTQVQFNSAGAFGGSVGFTWNKSSSILQVGKSGAQTVIGPRFVTTDVDTSPGFVIQAAENSGDLLVRGGANSVLSTIGGDVIVEGGRGTSASGFIRMGSILGATTATGGYVVIGTVSGTPTGVLGYDGAMVWDVSTLKLWMYTVGTGWKSAQFT